MRPRFFNRGMRHRLPCRCHDAGCLDSQALAQNSAVLHHAREAGSLGDAGTFVQLSYPR